MPPQSLSLSQKLSAFLARKIVWLWPRETKEWGLAFEAELPEITTPLASGRWVMGGVALLARESLRHFFKSLWRPLGIATPGDPSASTGNGGPAPRLPRLFAGLFLFASLAMLSLPEVRAHGRYYFWVGLTGVLSLVVLFLIYRMVPKRGSS